MGKGSGEETAEETPVEAEAEAPPPPLKLTGDSKLEVMIEYCTAERPTFSLRGDKAKYEEKWGAIQVDISSAMEPALEAPELMTVVANAGGRPRIGAFEVSFVFTQEGQVLNQGLLFSKLSTRKWPHTNKVADLLAQTVQVTLVNLRPATPISSRVKGQEEVVRAAMDQTLTEPGTDDTPQEVTGHTSQSGPAQSITILHFNDVYHIEARNKEPCGGASRFVQLIKNWPNNPLVLFAGDAFNPSLMSTITRGKHMVFFLNMMNINTALYGNHDFDFGLEELEKMSADCNFPWLLSNVMDTRTGGQLAGGLRYRVVEWEGRRLGMMGLIEKEWLVTLATINEEDVEYLDFVQCAKTLAAELRDEHKCQYIIALTHMRKPNDDLLAQMCPELDLILGGHDHDYVVEQINGTWVCKSGTDFRDLTEIVIDFSDIDKGGQILQPPKHIEIKTEMEEDETAKELELKYSKIIGDKMESVIGESAVDLDARFSQIRTKETNVGNFVADCMKEAMDTQCAILNCGTLRTDGIIPEGPFRLKDLTELLPMEDTCLSLSMNATQILNALENGVSQYPRLEGRFPAVAGLSFSFDPEKPGGERIDAQTLKICDEQVTDWKDKSWSVCTKAYLALGKDGYDVFAQCTQLIDEENGQMLPTIVRNHFTALSIANGFSKRTSMRGRRMSVDNVADKWKRASVSQQASQGASQAPIGTATPTPAAADGQVIKICPTVEGRIINVKEAAEAEAAQAS